MLRTSAVGTTPVYVVKFGIFPILSHSVERVERGFTVKPWKRPENTFYCVDGDSHKNLASYLTDKKTFAQIYSIYRHFQFSKFVFGCEQCYRRMGITFHTTLSDNGTSRY